MDAPARNPAWNRDELVLALDLYRANPVSPPGKGSPAVAALADLLNKMRRLTGEATNDTFRYANGVYMNKTYRRTCDRTFTATGKVGTRACAGLCYSIAFYRRLRFIS